MNADKLRFDFAHTGVIEGSQLEQIEHLVNQQVRLNTGVLTQLLSYDEAVKNGATALFGEKYGDQVRVLSMGDGFSMELCGGTHVDRTGDIGLFRIVSEAGIAAGIRRIEAVTGEEALQTVQDDQEMLAEIGQNIESEPARAGQTVTTVDLRESSLGTPSRAVGSAVSSE